MMFHLVAFLVGFGHSVNKPSGVKPSVQTNSNPMDLCVDMRVTAKGYEYVHPDISKLLLIPASWSETGECPFVVDPATLALGLKLDVNEGSDDVTSSSGFMPLHQLAYIAEQCEHAVFRMKLHDHDKVSGKILGLICLSQLSSNWPDGHNNTALSQKDEPQLESDDKSSTLLVATMVSLNLLESSIRSVIRTFNSEKDKEMNKVGAPLLRDMIETLSELDSDGDVNNRNEHLDLKCLATILRALLLPTRMYGINLRNLISHGFLSAIDRRWFALTLVLVQTLDSFMDHEMSQPCLSDVHHTGADLRKYPSMAKVVTRGQEILTNDIDAFQDKVAAAADFIPSSYRNLFQFIFRALRQSLNKETDVESRQSLNTIFLIAASAILEHSLRLKWCQANNKPAESIARTSKYFVTLDGHGQRDKHDVMIAPYLGDGSKNLLLRQLGSAAALASDLYSAPSSKAPNIRSQLCHGSWDPEVIRELELLANSYEHNDSVDKETRTRGRKPLSSSSNAYLLDSVCAVTALFDMLAATFAGDRLVRYEPVYSYVAMWRRDLAGSLTNLGVMKQLISEDLIAECVNKMDCEQWTEISNGLKAFELDLNLLRVAQQEVFPVEANSNIWAEYDMNIALSECIAVQTLLNEVSEAARKFASYLQGAVTILKQQPTSTKEKRSLKTTSRICGIASVVLDFYVLSANVCLVMMQKDLQLQNTDATSSACSLDRADYVKAIERSRMALSTFDNYLDKNLDRSMKALSQYLQGKALRKVMNFNHSHSSAS
ncbi:hypothetical protein ACHAXN_005419 [Cyclotella atomus]